MGLYTFYSDSKGLKFLLEYKFDPQRCFCASALCDDQHCFCATKRYVQRLIFCTPYAVPLLPFIRTKVCAEGSDSIRWCLVSVARNGTNAMERCTLFRLACYLHAMSGCCSIVSTCSAFFQTLLLFSVWCSSHVLHSNNITVQHMDTKSMILSCCLCQCILYAIYHIINYYDYSCSSWSLCLAFIRMVILFFVSLFSRPAIYWCSYEVMKSRAVREGRTISTVEAFTAGAAAGTVRRE